MIDQIAIRRFKSIADTELHLGRITVLVGPNNAGKSTLLQAIQFAVSVAQSLKMDGVARWTGNSISGTLATNQLVYTPLRDVHALATGGRLAQSATTSIEVEIHEESGAAAGIRVSRGKNKNISVQIEGKETGHKLQELRPPFSVVAPGLAGIPAFEELKSPGIVMRAAARGDANSVFRNILYRLHQTQEAWTEFGSRLHSLFPGLRVEVSFDSETDEHITVTVKDADGPRLPIDSCGTGVLQAIQILAYVGVYRPKLLILDEPDSHLHPDNQRRLAQLLWQLSEDHEFQVLLSTHSRHLLDELEAAGAVVHWVTSGDVQSEEFDTVTGLLEIGALDARDRLRNGAVQLIVITEDSDTSLLETLVRSSGWEPGDYEIWSYKSSSKLDSAILLGRFITDHAPGTKVVVHRDRDYLTAGDAKAYRDTMFAAGLFPFLTEGTSIEAHFLSENYLTQALPEVPGGSISECLESSMDAVKDESIRIMIDSRAESNSKSGAARDNSAGRVSMRAQTEFNESPMQLTHAKRWLKKFRSLMQEQHGVNRDWLVSHDTLSVDVLAELQRTAE
ncbi:AAA family ATPase [Oerskovia sp. NPDC060287]|uniref:AAA family ATPase n=1 Tax=Oerskovia sp. NPDC060287 TaxID=3347095 RepID=UPI003657ED7F